MAAFAPFLTTNLRTERGEAHDHNKCDTMGRDKGEPWLRTTEDLDCTNFEARSYLVGRSLVLGHTFCILATLCGRQFCYPNLPVTGTHGQSRITTVRKKLGLGC